MLPSDLMESINIREANVFILTLQADLYVPVIRGVFLKKGGWQKGGTKNHPPICKLSGHWGKPSQIVRGAVDGKEGT